MKYETKNIIGIYEMSHTSCDARRVSGNHLLVYKGRNDKEDDHPIVTLVISNLRKTWDVKLVREEVRSLLGS
jgi:hypothetical protein